MRMATTRILMGALVALQGGAALAATPVVTADRLLHVLAGRMVVKPAVVVVDGRILAVLTQGAAAIPKDATRIDLPGQTLLPGLIARRMACQCCAASASRVSSPECRSVGVAMACSSTAAPVTSVTRRRARVTAV